MSDDPPGLALASENDELELRKRKLIADLEWPTREMAANMLRVMRGAGRPYELLDQVVSLAIAIQEAGAVSNAWGIWSELEAVLQTAIPERYEGDGVGNARGMVVRGSLQISASTIIRQRTQAAAGEHELHEGIREMERIWERNRAEARASERPLPRSRKKRAETIRAMVAMPPPEPKKTEPEPEGAPKTTAEFMRLNTGRRRGGKQPV